jgi:hypothetical protein
MTTEETQRAITGASATVGIELSFGCYDLLVRYDPASPGRTSLYLTRRSDQARDGYRLNMTPLQHTQLQRALSAAAIARDDTLDLIQQAQRTAQLNSRL